MASSWPSAVDVERSRVDEYSDTYGIPDRFTTLENALAWGSSTQRST